MNQNQAPEFVIDDNPVVDWPVTVSLPAHGGKYVDFRFTASLRVLSPQEYDDLIRGANDGKDRPLPEVLQHNVQAFNRLVAGWDGVKDIAGNPVAFSQGRLAQEVTGPRGPALSVGLWRAINEVRFGVRLPDGSQQDGAALGN